MALSEFFIRYLQRRDILSGEDLDRLRQIRTDPVEFGPGEIIVPLGTTQRRSCMMLRGISGRVHRLTGTAEGSVITALHVPGDFVDLHAFVLTELDHDVVSFGRTLVEFVSHDQLTEITEHYPHLTRLLWMSTAIDAAIHRQWLVAATSLRSSAHLAHLLCELYTRLALVGAADDHRLTLPILQRELATMLGYSPIHINRAVRDLRDRKLIAWQGAEITILDWAGLVQLARFEPFYLNLERHRR